MPCAGATGECTKKHITKQKEAALPPLLGCRRIRAENLMKADTSGSTHETTLLALVLVTLFLLGGCGSKQPVIRTHGPGVDEPYVVNGRKYYPLLSAEGFEQEGIASWYGPGFDGKATSSGEIFDQDAMTAAHTILPFQSEIEVTNLRNGRSIVVRINDRGPFTDARVIDLSKAAAAKLDIIGTGTARVRLRHVGGADKARRPLPPAVQPAQVEGTFYIQVGVFGKRGNALSAMRKTRRLDMESRVDYRRSRWHVLLGPWSDLNMANDNLWRVRDVFPDAFVVSDDEV